MATKEDLDNRLSRVEGNHGRRLDLLEDGMMVTKAYFKRNPELKVNFN